ncbi:MAG: hypothetical protein NTV15_01330, partial [Candidatus Bathyarchaeota archaeon]|nr:hypothetical protein [Candidatus Bathyarchaeota archaeon]
GSHEICNPLGLDGVKYLLEETEGLPQKIFIGLSSATPPTSYETTGGYVGGLEANEALKLERVAGIDEVMDYTSLFNEDERLHSVIEAGLASGKVVEGHGVPSPPQADALIATGVSSTHFSGDGAKALALLERGCFLELKPRDSRKAIRELVAEGIDWQIIGMCVDDRPAEKISELGHLDYELEICIEEGLDPVTAIQLATAKDFEVKAPANKIRAHATVLRPFYFGTELPPITRELNIEDGLVQRDLSHDVNKVAIVSRDGKSIGISFWELGYQHGAVAMSILHDSHNISVVGATDADIAKAVNRVAEMGGGIAVVRDGVIKAEIVLSIAGLMTDRPLSEVVSGLVKVNEEAAKLSPGKLLGLDPVDTHTFIFLTCFPWNIVLTDQGLVNVRIGEKLSSVW